MTDWVFKIISVPYSLRKFIVTKRKISKSLNVEFINVVRGDNNQKSFLFIFFPFFFLSRSFV